MLSSYFSFSLILRASYSRNSMGNILAMSTNQMRSGMIDCLFSEHFICHFIDTLHSRVPYLCR